MGCFLCEAWKQGVSEETLVLHTTPHSMVIMNRYPYVAGHLLVCPKAHTSRPDALTDHQFQDLHRTLVSCVATVRDRMGAQGVNVGMNLGDVAGAGLKEHIHYHVIPRFTGDSNAFSILAEVRVIPEDLQATYHRLKPLFEALSEAKAG